MWRRVISWVGSSFSEDYTALLPYPEDGGSTLFLNIGTFLPNCRTSHPGRPTYSQSLLSNFSYYFWNFSDVVISTFCSAVSPQQQLCLSGRTSETLMRRTCGGYEFLARGVQSYRNVGHFKAPWLSRRWNPSIIIHCAPKDRTRSG